MEGRITDGANGTALFGAEVLVYRDGSADDPLLVIADSNGQYVAEDLAPGLYHVVAQRTNYVTAKYGERARDRSGVEIAIGAGQKVTGIDVRLMPCGIIAGRVLGDGNEPQVGATVAAMSAHFVNGQQRLSMDGTAIANDLGEYRLFGLRPGRYFIAAFPRNRLGAVRLPKDAPPEERYGISFYPDSAGATKAPPVNVRPGGELYSADIHLVRRRIFHVRGHIAWMGRGVQDLRVMLTPQLVGTIVSAGAQDAVPDSRGLFDFGGVLPGQYVVAASFTLQGRSYHGWQAVQVDESDVTVLMQPSPGLTIQGHIQVAGKNDVDLQSVRISLHPTYSPGFGQALHVSAEGSFMAYGSADIYHVEVEGLPAMLISNRCGRWIRMRVTGCWT